MKKYRAYSGVCFFLVLSIGLHGCDFGEGSGDEPPSQQASKPFTRIPRPPSPMKKSTTAKCHGGHFHCDGGWREWCNRMKKQCAHKKDCAPMCAWTCDSPKCNQECGPVCNQPACSTRCKGFNTDSCKMKCGKPQCKVVCPKHFCPSQDCAACKTECGKPACKMECGVDEQPCRHVCAQPLCKWECKNPSLCPKPKCAMKCKKEPECMQTMHMFSKVPPLEPGETEIVTAEMGPSPAPALLQRTSGSMNVNFTGMDEDGKLHTGQVKLAMVQVSATDDSTDGWTKMVSEVAGQVSESEASCTNGKFHCTGDTSWCAEQEKLGCPGSVPMYSRKKSQMQHHLQA